MGVHLDLDFLEEGRVCEDTNICEEGNSYHREIQQEKENREVNFIDELAKAMGKSVGFQFDFISPDDKFRIAAEELRGKLGENKFNFRNIKINFIDRPKDIKIK